MTAVTKTETPPVFRDDAGRDWTIRLSVQAADDVLEQTQVDLLRTDNETSQLTGLLFDPRKLSAVLWALCRKQAEAKDINQTQFREGLEADGLTKGWEAICNAVVFFIRRQSPKMGEAVEKIIEAQLKVIETGTIEILKTIESQEVDAAVKATTKRIAEELKASVIEQFEKSVST